MPDLSFGQPESGIIQMAYVVEDIQASMEAWTRDTGTGPWFVLDSFTGVDPVYRGQPAQGAVSIAMGFAGHMQIELLQPLDDHASVYKDTIDTIGYGFHHWGIGSRTFDADIAKYEALGYELAFKAGVPTGGSVGYMDTKGALPGFIEVIEIGEGMDAAFTSFYAASLAWDGSDPVRSFG